MDHFRRLSLNLSSRGKATGMRDPIKEVEMQQRKIDRRTVNPNATYGAGRGSRNGVGLSATPGLDSMGPRVTPEMQQQKQLDATRSGAFGATAQRVDLFSQMKQSGAGGITPEMRQTATKIGITTPQWDAAKERIQTASASIASPSAPTSAAAPPASIMRPPVAQTSAQPAMSALEKARMQFPDVAKDFAQRRQAAVTPMPSATPAAQPVQNPAPAIAATPAAYQPSAAAQQSIADIRKTSTDRLASMGFAPDGKSRLNTTPPAAPPSVALAAAARVQARPATQQVGAKGSGATFMAADPKTLPGSFGKQWDDSAKQTIASENAKKEQIKQKQAAIKIPSWQQGTGIGPPQQRLSELPR